METTNEATYNFGKEEYTKKNLTPTDILDLAFAYTQTPITRIVGKKLDDRIKTANDVSRLTGMMQLEPTKKSGKPALILHLLKNSLVTKDEYIKLFKELVEVHKSIVKYLKNASPERRNAGAAKAAAKDMKGEFDESVNEGHFGEIDIMAQNASNFREFVKDFYKEYKDFAKTKESLKWLESLYKSRANEGLDSQGLERVGDGLPQTEEEPKSENIRLKNLMN